MLKTVSDFLVISDKHKHKGLTWLLRAVGTHYSSTCFIGFLVKKGWEQHGSSQPICAREMSVTGVFGKVTQKERKGYIHERKALALIYEVEHLLSDFILRISGKELL